MRKDQPSELDSRAFRERLTDDAKLVYLAMFRHPRMTTLGLLVANGGTLADFFGWPAVRATEAIRCLDKEKFIRWHPRDNVIVVPAVLEENVPESPNGIKHALKSWRVMPDCPAKADVIVALRVLLPKALQRALAQALRGGLPTQGGGETPEDSATSNETKPPAVAASNQEPAPDSQRGAPPHPPTEAKVLFEVSSTQPRQEQPRAGETQGTLILKEQTGKPARRIAWDKLNKAIVGVVSADVAKWREAYPGVDPEAEVKRAALWLGVNPTRVPLNLERFLLSWMARTHETIRKTAAINKTQPPAKPRDQFLR